VILCEVGVIFFGALSYLGKLGAPGYLALACAFLGHLALLMALLSLRRRVSVDR
jgi:hypothetical protein